MYLFCDLFLLKINVSFVSLLVFFTKITEITSTLKRHRKISYVTLLLFFLVTLIIIFRSHFYDRAPFLGSNWIKKGLN